MRRNSLPILLIAVLFLASVACKALSPTTPQPEKPNDNPVVKAATATSSLQEPQPTRGESRPEEKPAATLKPTSTSIPTGTPVPQASPLVVSDVWFAHDSQSKTSVWYAFFLENPNPDLGVVETQFQVVGYDSAGAVLATATMSVPVIFPGEKLGIVGYALNVPDNTTVAKLDVQPSREGEGKAYHFQGSPLKVEKSSFFHSQYRNQASGMIENTDLDENLTNLAVSVLAYDGNGKVIGVGNNTYIPFVPANGRIGVVVDMHMTTDDLPMRLEFYPTFSSGWNVIKTSEQGIVAEVTATGFSQDDYGTLTWAFLAQNPSAEKAIQYAPYQVTAFDKDENVLATSASQISLIFPDERFGASSTMSVPENAQAAKIEVAFAPPPTDQYDSWNLDKLGLKENPLTAEAPTFFDSQYNPKVTGIVKNSYDKEVNVNITIVLYDAGGAIIGGGTSYVTIPAKGQAAIEVYVRTSAKPDKIEVFPSLSSPPS